MYTIKYTDGQDSQEATDLSAAYTAMQLEFGDCHIEECGDRWLVWASEEEFRNDDGAKAIAEIKKA